MRPKVQLTLLSARKTKIDGKWVLHAIMTGPSETDLMMRPLEFQGERFVVREIRETGWGNPEHTFEVVADAI